MQITLPDDLHKKLLDIVAAERSLRDDVRFSPAEKVAELIRDYELPEDIAALIGTRRR